MNINEFNSQKEGENVALEEIQNKIQGAIENIENLEFKKNSIQNIQFIQSPIANPFPVKPRKKLNVALATIVGLFTMLLLSFFLEYISGHKRRKNNEKTFG